MEKVQRIVRKSGSISLIVFLLVLGTVCVSFQIASAQSSPSTFKWRMQSIDPPALIGPSITQKAFCDRVRNMSNGRLDITLYTAGQLTPSMEIIGSLGKGTIDISYTCNSYYTGSVPETNIDLLTLPPLLLKTFNDAIQVYWYNGGDEILREGYAERGVYYLGSLFWVEPITFWTKRPIKTVADLKGQKIRSFGGYVSKTIAKLGASPTVIPHEEVYTALAQGAVDGSMTAGSYYKRLKYYEVAPYYYLPGFYTSWSMCLVVSQESWKKLPDDLKAILKEALVSYTLDHSQRTWWEHEEMLQELPKLKSTLITWPETELQKIREASLSFLPEISKKSPRCAKGVKLIEDYMKAVGYGK